ncbi:unnamed protein product [Cuscuta campestris]|uniref:RNase H type-1 domain-containing protein n=1 Tax=Cuscuta campestris TaxID=132261 RepID=A0A484MXT2_9ASTE|nr:unnamed protein product [Cuscuta campestris]
MVQTRSNVPTTCHVVGEENAPGSGNGTGGIGSTPDAVQALFGLGVTAEQLQAAVAALSAMGGNVPGAGVGKAPPGLHAEHVATSQHKGKKTRRSRRRPGKAQVRLGGEETRVSAFDKLDRGPEGHPGDLRRQITEGRQRHAEESATSDARSARPERSEERRDGRTQRRHSSTRTEKTKVFDQGVSRLAREIAELKRRVETRAPYSQPILRTVTPFTPRVMSVLLPASFQPWQIKAYNGTTDPQNHLSKFYASMEAAAAPDEEKEARDVHGADDQSLVATFQAALPRGEVRKELHKNPPPTYQETLARAKFLASEEFDDAPDSEAAPAKRAPADSEEIAKKRKKKKDYTVGLRTPSAGVYSVGASVGTGRELALSPLLHVETYAVSSGAKYCEYHRNNTHNTKECFTLQKEMQRLIARGPAPRDDGAAPSRSPPEGRTWRKPTELVAVATQKWKHMAFVAKVQQAPAPKLGRREQIQFTEKDLPNTPSPHRDALVVRIKINNAIVHRTLVDTGSSVNIMYEKTFQDLGLDRKDLRPVRTPLSGFTGDSIKAEGVITVPVIVGDGAHKAKLKMEFMVVSISCTHNMILGRPGLEDLECVISPYYLCMKFPTPSGIGVTRGDQKLARSCYVRITKKLSRDENWSCTHKKKCGSWKHDRRPSPLRRSRRCCSTLEHPSRRSPNAPSCMSKWAVFLGAFQIEFRPRAAIKGQALADFVVECTAWEEPSPEEPEADDWWIVSHSIHRRRKLGGGVANDERMKKYKDTALELLKSFTAYSVEQIPRAENAEADILSKLSSDTPEHIRRMANVEELSEPSIHASPVAMICARPRDWMDDIVAFLKDGAPPRKEGRA